MNKNNLEKLIKIFFNEYATFLEICKKENFKIPEKKNIFDKEDCCNSINNFCENEESEYDDENITLNYALYFSFIRITLFFQTIIVELYFKKNQKILNKNDLDVEDVLKWLKSSNILNTEEEANSIATAVIFAQETNNPDLNNDFYTYDSDNYFSPVFTSDIIALTIENLVKIIENIEKTK